MNHKNIVLMIQFLLVYLYISFLVDPLTIIKNEKRGIGLALNLNPLKDPKKAPMGY